MRHFILSFSLLFLLYALIGFGAGNYLIAPAFAVTPVDYSILDLTNDPHARFRDGIFRGSVVTDEVLSVYVGESSWLNEWDYFEIWYEKHDETLTNGSQWVCWPIDTQTYYYVDLHYDSRSHADTLTTVLTDVGWSTNGSTWECEYFVYCVDIEGV